jgi:hypothetical protein
MMRDPNLVEARTANDLRVKPPHGRQTRVALGLEANGDDNTNASAYSQPSTSGRNGNLHMIRSRDLYGDRPEKDYVDRRQNGLTPSSARETTQPSQISAPGRPQAPQRARSDFGPRHRRERNAAVIEEDLWRMRHGWEDEYTSNEYLALLNSVSLRIRQNYGVC